MRRIRAPAAAAGGPPAGSRTCLSTSVRAPPKGTSLGSGVCPPHDRMVLAPNGSDVRGAGAPVVPRAVPQRCRTDASAATSPGSSSALPAPAGQCLELGGLVGIERAGALAFPIGRLPDGQRKPILGGRTGRERE